MSVDPRTGHTDQGVPYVLGPDTMIDYPADSLELATWIGDHRGRELAGVIVAADTGPTRGGPARAGDALVDLGPVTTRAVMHEWESTLLVRSSVPNDSLFLLLYDGPPSAPGDPIAYAPLYAPSAGGLLACVRLRFTPPAGARNYHLRWRNQGGAGTVWTILNSLYQGTHTIREVTL